MARITRKELKTDTFALEVEHGVDFFEEHRGDVIKYGAIAVVAIAIVAAIWFYRNHEHTVREAALTKAFEAQQAPIGEQPNAPLSFPTQEAKDKEVSKRFQEVASKYSGSDEGYIAEYYLGGQAADHGNLAEAEKRFKSVVDGANAGYASLGKLALAQLDFAQNKPADGEKLLRDLMEKPTVFVSREQATITLARNISATKPAEAKRLLEPLRASPGKTGQAAIQAFADLPQQ